MIAASVDDRTPQERGLEPLRAGDRRIFKSRYDTIDMFISEDPTFKPEYNDIEVVYDEQIFRKLRESGLSELLAKHVAHLFIRDPLVVYSELLQMDDLKSSDHFENIQSTNWNSVRFKPPPPGSDIGWRVEFRPLEVQITDFENAAFNVFVMLICRLILVQKLNLYIPISKVDENMAVAHRRGSVLMEKFFFRTDVLARPLQTSTAHLARLI